MNKLEAVSIVSPYGETEECAKIEIEDVSVGYMLDNITAIGQKYTLQFWAKAASKSAVTVAGKTFVVTTSWTECVTTFDAESADLIFLFSAAGVYYIFEPQLENGNQKTDYSEAPEDMKDEITKIKVEAGRLKIELGTKVTQEDVDKSIGAIDEFHGTTVDITSAGFAIKTGGTFTVDSKKFDIDENGEMSAVNARISGQLSVEGNDVWHKGQLIVSTAQPSNPSTGTIWVKPDLTAIPAAGTWSLNALTSRPDVWTNNYDYALSGTNIGAAPSNATYTYEVSVPVYYGYNGSGACDVTVYLGASSGAATISMGTKTFSDANKGGNMYTATVTSNTWLGNAGTIYMRVNFSAPNLMTVNSHSPFTCTLTAKSSTATGWKVCEVQMYTG